jgi:curved DNA-binding protein CbpA
LIEDPHAVLGLAGPATEQAVRQRYLELVRQFPPDRSPERFAAIRAAYEALKDPVERLKNQLFSVKQIDSFDQVLADLRRRHFDPRRIPLKKILEQAERS